MDLHHSIAKAFSIAAFFGVTLAPHDHARGVRPVASNLPSAALSTSASAHAAPTAPASDRDASVCGEGMLLVEGDACPDAEHVCVTWLDPPPYQNLRCAEYARPAKCKAPRVPRRFCIDRREFAEPASAGDADALPIVKKNWGEAKALCEARGARLCKEAEWEFACEGPEMSPYPYGWKRDATICNFDKTDLGGPMEKLNDLRAPLSAYPDCVSPFGVHNMVGNVDEWVEREGRSAPNRGALRGGWWLPGRNRCRAATVAHGEDYAAKQVGFRCCKDAPATSEPREPPSSPATEG